MYIICIIYVLYMYYIRIIYVLYMYYMCIICVFAGFIWLFLGFLRPRRFLSVFLLALSGFSWVFCVRGVFCLCFCWFYLAFLRFLASAAFFVCAFAGFFCFFLGFWNPSWADLQLGRTSNSVLPKSVLGGPPTRD